jgi:hypothetical protein
MSFDGGLLLGGEWAVGAGEGDGVRIVLVVVVLFHVAVMSCPVGAVKAVVATTAHV